ncbi:hypothetical protein CEXT_353901 [Caerostris extrusa]|uniref:Uncharacterized protein n=1 Tax=Caerostris extrusa TaxID=172846 RepID=A0AAV4X1R3_CAEEX|nr:hypothetical protein CEXT_353901 [Caerostris extrusa]
MITCFPDTDLKEIPLDSKRYLRGISRSRTREPGLLALPHVHHLRRGLDLGAAGKKEDELKTISDILIKRTISAQRSSPQRQWYSLCRIVKLIYKCQKSRREVVRRALFLRYYA